MDSSVVEKISGSVAFPKTRKARDASQAMMQRKRSNGKDSGGEAGTLIVSFAQILLSKVLGVNVGIENRAGKEDNGNVKQTDRKGKETWLPTVKGQTGQVKIEKTQQAAAIQTPAEGQLAETRKEAALTSSEETLLREMVQKKGTVSGRKGAARTTGFVNGEPLNRFEGVGAIQSMAAKEGKVLQILSGAEGAQEPQKPGITKPAKAQQAFVLSEAGKREEKASRTVSSSEPKRHDVSGLPEKLQDTFVEAGPAKKQTALKGLGAESRDLFTSQVDFSSPVREKAPENSSVVRPQAVMGQVIDGAAQVLRNGSGRMVLTLQPPELGTLDLDVAVRNNRVEMVLLADNQEVKQMLQSGMDDLRNSLQDKGYQIDRMEVLVKDRAEETDSGFWQEAGFAREDSPSGEQRRRKPETVNTVRGMQKRTILKQESGISIFA